MESDKDLIAYDSGENCEHKESQISALDELVKFCLEDRCVGALLLTGDWGCGKTWLIEQKLKPMVEKTAVLIRVSLFGLSTAEEIHNAVKKDYVNVVLAEKKISKAANILSTVKSKLSSMQKLLPDVLNKIASIDIMPLFEVESEIDGKKLILVFDDFERCKADMIDIFGAINKYCENKKIRTIIVANEERIEKGKKGSVSEKMLSYSEIKEKIIQRTVHFRPAGRDTIDSVLDSLFVIDGSDVEVKEYSAFVKSQKEDLVILISDSRKTVNLRSLKCALIDYARIYKTLKVAGITEQKSWFLNFVSYVLDVKSGMNEEKTDEVDSEENKKSDRLPENQRNNYVLDGVKLWVTKGEWNEANIMEEAQMWQDRVQGNKPFDMIRRNALADLDEESIQKGWQPFLDNAYSGNINLDNYVQLIRNSCWARAHRIELPSEIDWGKIKQGISRSIQRIEKNTSNEENELSMNVQKQLNAVQQEALTLTEEEKCVYAIISDYRESGALRYSKARKNYIARMQSDPMSAFALSRDVMFGVFTLEMAEATGEAFEKLSNADKNLFVKEFRTMWTDAVPSKQRNNAESYDGFLKLQELLENLKTSYSKSGKSVAAVHADCFCLLISEILGMCEKTVPEMSEKSTEITENALDKIRPYTEDELNGLRYYQGDIQNLKFQTHKDELKEFYKVNNAYEVLNTLLYPGISNEEARVIKEKRKLSPILLDHMEEVLKIYENMLSAIYKYKDNKTKERTENPDFIETVRFDRENSLQFLLEGENCSFMSTTRGVDLDYFRKKSGLILEEIVAEAGTPCIDLYEVLGEDSKYAYEREVLFPPFVKLEIQPMELTEQERGYEDMNGNPPIGKRRICMKKPKSASEIEYTEESREQTMEKLKDAILDSGQIQNAKAIWKNMEKGFEMEGKSKNSYINWKKQISEYVRRCMEKFENMRSIKGGDYV